jgi:Tannase and feruloyl esterase
MKHGIMCAVVGALLLPAASPLAVAQSAGNFSEAVQSPVRYTGAETHPRIDCRSLMSLAGRDVIITAADDVAAAPDKPAYCRVLGMIAPEIQFEIDLPANWNRRLYMFGNGGYAGENLDAPLRQALSATALRTGFLTVQTNTGHDATREPLGSFAAANLQKLVDYAFRAVHESVGQARRAADAYYGRDVAFAYWDGCSTGGRQGLISAQRFPDDFDGILAGAPVLNFTDTMVNFAWNSKALDGAGLTLGKMKSVADAVYGRCDGKDGVKDVLLSDPRQCDFDPARDVKPCEAGHNGDDCLTAAQSEAINKVYSGITLPDGGKYFFGWPRGTEMAGAASDRSGQQESGWARWLIDPQGKASIQTTYAKSFMQTMAFGRADPTLDPLALDFQKDPARMAAIRRLLNADEADLSAFRRHGGKLIMYHGWADPALTPFMSLDYHDRAVAANGPDTHDFFRLFMVPGMNHCRGGIGTDRFDAMSAIVNWVEAGTAPDRIVAARMRDGKVDRTRPLCPHPLAARYSGSGSIDEAVNFVCRPAE